jgi:hypothetical protein
VPESSESHHRFDVKRDDADDRVARGVVERRPRRCEPLHLSSMTTLRSLARVDREHLPAVDATIRTANAA